MARGARLRRQLPAYGLPILTLALILLFSVLLPRSFPTALNLRSILGDKSIVAILSLSAMLPMVVGRIDLTVGYGIVLWHILAIGLQTEYGLSWIAAVAIVLASGAAFGLINGLLVEVAEINAFMATLGTGTIVYAIALWHTNGRQIIGLLPDGFLAINGTWVLGVPIASCYVLALALLLWIVLERLPIGRHLYAIGGNQLAAELNGIPARAYIVGVFVASGLLTAFAGIVLASKLQIGQASVGLEYLLPALVGAFLGSTTIRPGRMNVWGTLVGVLILAVGISGIQLFGGAFFVEPLLNGSILLVAIALAGYAQRRRSVVRDAA